MRCRTVPGPIATTPRRSQTPMKRTRLVGSPSTPVCPLAGRSVTGNVDLLTPENRTASEYNLAHPERRIHGFRAAHSCRYPISVWEIILPRSPGPQRVPPT